MKSEKRGEEDAKLMEGAIQLPTIMEPYIIPHHRIYICVSLQPNQRIQIRDIICTVRMEMMRQQIKICPEIEIKILVAQQNICRPLSLINKYYNH